MQARLINFVVQNRSDEKQIVDVAIDYPPIALAFIKIIDGRNIYIVVSR